MPDLTAVPNDTLLDMQGIHKRFPGVHALKGVDLQVRRGEVHAVVGENGAGKSTLMMILAGVYPPDEGSIAFDGRANVVIRDERHAQELGIAIVFQERSLFPMLSVAENIFAGRQPVRALGLIDRHALARQSRELLDTLELDIDPHTPLSRLSFAQQQMVEVAKALSLRAKLLILDEPTAALTDVETEALFRIIRRLQAQGVGVIHISHRLNEVFQIAERATVLKDGANQGTLNVKEVTPRDLVSRMVGREALHDVAGRDLSSDLRQRVQVSGLSDPASGYVEGVRLKQIHLRIRQGEILGIAGLEGSGRSELARALFGARPSCSGEVRIDGQPVRLRSPQDAIAAGIGYLPSDRKESGLFLEMSIANNIASASLRRFGRFWMSEKQRDQTAEAYRQKLQIAAPSVRREVRTLSGGNQQKVVLSKWLLVGPRVLIVDEPTRGIDVSVKVEVHRLLRQFTESGAVVIVSSSDLPELLAICDRILVMRDGQIRGELHRQDATEEKIMQFASIG